MYLYFGYLLVQLYPLIIKKSQLDISMSAIIFSMIVFFIWSFIPITGYWLGRLVSAKKQTNHYVLFIFGVCVGLIENTLFYFDLLSKGQQGIGMLITFTLFFIVACIPINRIN